MNRTYRLGLRAILFAAVAALLAACGNDDTSVNRVISFGDSLSDVGTYKVGAPLAVGGGRFTTNPGQIWVERVAANYGLSVTPNVQGGFGVAVTQPGGMGFAQGGSRVTAAQGIGCAIDNNTGGCTLAAALTYPVATQLANFKTARIFTSRDLVLVLAGANDIFAQYAAAGAAVPITPDQATTNVQTAATELANLVKTEIIGRGAMRVAVLNVPDIGATPFGSIQSAAGKALLTGLVQAFNTQLAAGLAGTIAMQIDLYSHVNAVLAAPATYSVSNVSLPACSAAAISMVTGGLVTDGSSLFCSVPGTSWAGTLVAANADTQYLFADGVHPTTQGHKLIADYVLSQLPKF